MSKFISHVVHSLKEVKLHNHKMFSLSPPAAKAAHVLSREDWRNWLPSARPPFERMVIDWPTTAYVRSGDKEFIINMGDKINLDVPEDRTHHISDIYTPSLDSGIIERLALIITKGADHDDVTYSIAMDAGPKCRPMIGPWIASGMGAKIIWASKGRAERPYTHNEKEHHDAWLREMSDLAWGPALVAKWGMPPLDLCPICPNPSIVHLNRKQAMSLMKECAGQMRVAFAALALMNEERDTIVVPESHRRGRTMSMVRGVGSTPNYVPTEIIVRPDLPRRVHERTKSLMPGSPKCHHEVKGHWRYLDHRPNHHWEEWRCEDGVIRWRRFIKEHERGDKALGSTKHTYAVDVDPAQL